MVNAVGAMLKVNDVTLQAVIVTSKAAVKACAAFVFLLRVNVGLNEPKLVWGAATEIWASLIEIDNAKAVSTDKV